MRARLTFFLVLGWLFLLPAMFLALLILFVGDDFADAGYALFYGGVPGVLFLILAELTTMQIRAKERHQETFKRLQALAKMLAQREK